MKKWWKKSVSGEFTVEASIVVPVVLIAVFLIIQTGIFLYHKTTEGSLGNKEKIIKVMEEEQGGDTLRKYKVIIEGVKEFVEE